jgi:amino acid permease
VDFLITAVVAGIVQGIGGLITNAISTRISNSNTRTIPPRRKKSRSKLKVFLMIWIATALIYFSLKAFPEVWQMLFHLIGL